VSETPERERDERGKTGLSAKKKRATGEKQWKPNPGWAKKKR